MFKKILLIFMFIAVMRAHQIGGHPSIIDFGSNCLIHNKAFRFEYLYSTNDTIEKTTAKKTDHLISLNKVNDFNMIRWSLIETNNQTGRFYLKSAYFGDFLCATTKFADFFRSKRIVTRLRLNMNYDFSDNCKWMLKRVRSSTSFSIFLMINVLFNEPLYADSYLFKSKIDQREIFLNNKKNFITEKMKWMVDCQTGDYLWI
jgi:hypothetical protein